MRAGVISTSSNRARRLALRRKGDRKKESCDPLIATIEVLSSALIVSMEWVSDMFLSEEDVKIARCWTV